VESSDQDLEIMAEARNVSLPISVKKPYSGSRASGHPEIKKHSSAH
jgi:hypothetical protein